MKLLHLVASLEPEAGGVSRAVKTMIRSLSEMGVGNEVAALSISDPGTENGFVHSLGPGKGPWKYSPKLYPWLLKSLDKYDSVILHGLWLYPGFATERAMRILKDSRKKGRHPKLFIMPHGMLDPYFQNAAGRTLKAIRNTIYWKLVENRVINNADGLLFTSEEEYRLARMPFRPYKPRKELVVGLGVEEPEPYRMQMRDAFLSKCSAVANRPYFLFLGRIHEKKGVDILIEAYADVFLKKGNENSDQPTGCALVIAGPGIDSAFGKKIRQLVPRLDGSEENIFFPGMLSGDEKWGALYGSEAFVLPSHQENFCIAAVETMACGKAVLLSKKVNIWKEIEEGGAGLVEEDNIGGMKNLLMQWESLSEQEKAQYGFRSRLLYQKNFSPKPAAERLIKAIE